MPLWPFNKKKTVSKDSISLDSNHKQKEAFMRALAEEKKKNPFAGIKLGAKEIELNLISRLKNEKGVHIETLLTVAAALAGYSCQMAMREQYIKTGIVTEKDAFVHVQMKTGEQYYMAGLIYKPLSEDEYSVWTLVGGGLQAIGAQLPDFNKIAKYGVDSMGTDNFAIPRVDQNMHKSSIDAIHALKNMWATTLEIIKPFCNEPKEWPVLLGILLQNLIIASKDVISPDIAGIIIMDTLMATSKLDPKMIENQQL